MCKVSIIVPVYNKENYLNKCLDSLLNSTLSDLEIICVNDSSTDKSLDILNSYKEKIKLINHETNMGIGKTRNDGLKLATGEYIGFIDSDDYIDSKMYEEYYNFAKNNNLDLVVGDYYKDFNGTLEYFKNPSFNTCNIIDNPNIINLIDYGPCNKLFKREIITKNNILFDEILKYEDMPFVAKAIQNVNKIGKLDQALNYYCIHESSETTTMNTKVFDMFKIMEQINAIYINKTSELEYLNITQITRYMGQQKYQKDKKLKNRFIKEGFEFLNNNFSNWKQNKYFKQQGLKGIFKSNKILLKIYCLIKK